MKTRRQRSDFTPFCRPFSTHFTVDGIRLDNGNLEPSSSKTNTNISEECAFAYSSIRNPLSGSPIAIFGLHPIEPHRSLVYCFLSRIHDGIYCFADINGKVPDKIKFKTIFCLLVFFCLRNSAHHLRPVLRSIDIFFVRTFAICRIGFVCE